MYDIFVSGATSRNIDLYNYCTCFHRPWPLTINPWAHTELFANNSMSQETFYIFSNIHFLSSQTTTTQLWDMWVLDKKFPM